MVNRKVLGIFLIAVVSLLLVTTGYQNAIASSINSTTVGADASEVEESSESQNATAMTAVTNETPAFTSNMSQPIELGVPFYVERYANSSIGPQEANTTFATTTTGSGTLYAENGTVDFETDVNAIVMFRDSETFTVRGNTTFVATNGDATTTHEFLELGKINPDEMTYSGSGIGIFGEEATGELAPLSNKVAVFRSFIDANGNSTIFYYDWDNYNNNNNNTNSTH